MMAEPGIAKTTALAVLADISIVGIGVAAEDSYLTRERLLTNRGVAASGHAKVPTDGQQEVPTPRLI